MKSAISESSLSRISEFISSHMGLYFPKERWHDLERGIMSVSHDFKCKNPEACIQWILSSPLTKSRIEIIASHLTVGETYFFRNQNIFNALERQTLPELIHSRRKSGKHLRFWSAACASGEEPYSLAILLSKMIPDLSDWNITILATDINPLFLKKASKGIYTKWSFRSTPEWAKFGYFKKTKKGHYQVNPQLKKMVRFSYLNLMDDCYPSMTNNTNAMDVIFCRNVLMYFSPEYREQVIHRMYRSIVDGGQMVVSPGEIPHTLNSLFNTVQLNRAIIYRKGGDKTPTRKDYKINKTSNNNKTSSDSQKKFLVKSLIPNKIDIAEKIIPQSAKVLSGSPTVQKLCQSFYQDAVKLFKTGHYAEAAESLQELLSKDPTNSDAMTLLVKTYANEGNLAKATQWCEKLISNDKVNPYFYYLLSTIFVEQDMEQEAVAALKKVLYLDYNFVLAYFTLGNINRRRGKLKESTKNFDNAVSLLSRMQTEEILPESDGITAGRLMEIIKSSSGQEVVHE